MNKADLTEIFATEADLTRVKAAKYLNIIIEVISETLANGEKVTISDFGTFTVSQRKAFKGYNPKADKPVDVPARRIPVFRAGKALKSALNA